MTRLDAPYGSLIDRNRPVRFTFEGRRVDGCEGDTIASALAANGIWLLSRSFKYRRPRGVLSMAGHDANSLVQLRHEPNVLADRHPISDGLEVTGQNYEGSLARDKGRWIERFARFLPPGFYYRAFFRPSWAWRLWEPVIRRRAGLGRVRLDTPQGGYDKAYAFADVAVVGGGAAGMAAALEASRGGGEVVLIDEWPRLGGALNWARFEASGALAAAERARLLGAIRDRGNIAIWSNATVTGLFADNWLAVLRGNRLLKLRAGAVVVATGCMEQPAVFRNNDLPGVMLGSAAQRLIRLYGVRPGRRAVVLTANGDGYGVALDLDDAGVEVAAVVDLREAPEDDSRAREVARQGIAVRYGETPAEALSRRGGSHVAGLRLGSGEDFACDLVTMSVGVSPAAQLLLHRGARLDYEEETAAFVVRDLPDRVQAAGAVDQCLELSEAMASGYRRGWTAAEEAGCGAGTEPPTAPVAAAAPNHPWPVFPHPKGKCFVDFDEDQTVEDIEFAAAEGYDHAELMKRYTTVGMGPSQGRLSALNAARILARAAGRTVAEVGTSTSRPPYAPEKFGHLAGRGFHPVRVSPMHRRHLEAGAQMMPAGLWLRPAFYGSPDRIAAEALNVRRNVGLIDVSTLGGMDVRGPDAAAFLERIYTFAYQRQPVGRARYVLMTDRTGAILDDGVACRFHDEHFYVTATTGGADEVYRSMLWWNAQWRMDVDVANVTAAYAGISIAGPRSRAVLARLCDGVDLSADAFPYMGVREGRVAGVPARLLRVGFVGELGYEVHVGAGYGEAVWDALMQAGAPEGIRPFGVEAQRLLRLEKGHIIVGQDTDGLTHPLEADMAWAIARAKPYFVGGRAIAMQEARGLARKLVGFRLPDDAPLPKECHLTVRDGRIVGRVTSVARSATLDCAIGLAYVAPDQAEAGSRFTIKGEGGRLLEAEVVPLPFYDPANARQAL